MASVKRFKKEVTLILLISLISSALILRRLLEGGAYFRGTEFNRGNTVRGKMAFVNRFKNRSRGPARLHANFKVRNIKCSIQ